jgi:hypothetical protein
VIEENSNKNADGIWVIIVKAIIKITYMATFLEV